MKRKMQFVSNIMSATIQNIAKQKSGTDTPAITKDDLVKSMRLAFLVVYPGNTMVNTSAYHAPLGYKPHTFLYYVKGIGTNQAEPKWLAVTNYDDRTSPGFGTGTGQWGRTSLKYVSGESSNIHPDLVINSGDVKMVLECMVFYTSNQSKYYFSPNHPRYPNKSTAEVSPRDAFGFLFLNPKYHDIGYQTYKSNFFNGVTIFVPIGSAFSETAPK